MRDNPDLLPIEDFSLSGPVLLIGREASVQSGAIDLACLARGGEILIVEFKTGPENTDFRHAVAQLLDYGAQIWRRSFAEFEQAVAVRFFSDERRCLDVRLRGKRSLEEAAQAVWTNMLPEEWKAVREKIESQLGGGSFHYILVAQRFTPGIQNVVDYLNFVAPTCRFFAVEVVRFLGDGLSAFESRTVQRPAAAKVSGGTAALTNEADFLAKVEDLAYRAGLLEFFEACRGLQYRFDWGALGTSIRLATPFRAEPVTVAWVYPPGRSGWSGLTDLSLGYDQWTADNAVGSAPDLEWYLEQALALAGAEQIQGKSIRAARFRPEAFLGAAENIIAVLAELAARMQREA